MNEAVLALGRMKAGAMNKTEKAYADHLERLKHAGDIVWYEFESIKFKLGDKTFYTPDFVVMRPDGLLEVHEVKGFWRDDARVKIKVAAERFPMVFVAVKALSKKQGGGWDYENFSVGAKG